MTPRLQLDVETAQALQAYGEAMLRSGYTVNQANACSTCNSRRSEPPGARQGAGIDADDVTAIMEAIESGDDYDGL